LHNDIYGCAVVRVMYKVPTWWVTACMHLFSSHHHLNFLSSSLVNSCLRFIYFLVF
jgi:hypothetical protein